MFLIYSNNPNILRPLIAAILLVLLSSACQVNHFTGKKNFNAIPNSQLFPMAFAQYDAFLKEHKVITGTSDARQITRVGEQISGAAQRYFEFKGLPNALKDYRWEYHLVHNAQKNAWCMPGGKILHRDSRYRQHRSYGGRHYGA